ncbi:3-oxoacyl-[acyl-carrier-protein] synthase-3 [Bacillus sp. OV194]|nr:3-oxoacyl-[acyl-carrier-protein] synthase-3 [Bacillus sp. OV194]
MKSKARLTAIGTYVPEKVLTNEDLQKLVDTSYEWIVQRTGMKERRVAGENELLLHWQLKQFRILLSVTGKNSMMWIAF